MSQHGAGQYIRELREENAFLISQNKELRYLLIYMDRFADKLGVTFNGNSEFVDSFLRKVAKVLSEPPAYINTEKQVLAEKKKKDAILLKIRQEKKRQRKEARKQKKALTAA